MFRRALLCALVLTLVTAAPALASPRHHHNPRHHTMTSWSVGRDDRGDTEDDSSDDSADSGSDDSTDTTTPDTGVPGAAGGVVATGTQQTINAQVTGFSWADNSPPGSSTVCCGVLHTQAGGTGTYADPITTAVPGSGGQGMETPAGTRIYVARLKRYFIVEDSGATKMSAKHFDLWVDGQGFPKSASDKCMDSYTGSTPVIVNPPAGEPVTVGPLTGSSGCRV